MPVPSNMPERAQRMWEEVYASARDRGYNEERSAKQAWGVVKRFYRKQGDRWIPRKHPKVHVAARGRVVKA